MNTKDKINSLLGGLKFNDFGQNDNGFQHYCRIADSYAEVEHAIAGVSDLKDRIGYITFGNLAEILNVGRSGEGHMINSIWEEEVYSLLEPEDVERRHIDELYFMHFLRTLPVSQRRDYHLNVYLRVKKLYGPQLIMRHRTFCLGYRSNGSWRYMLAVYTLAKDDNNQSAIVNSITGESIAISQADCQEILTRRERQILIRINKGAASKQIADDLSISIHTVNRHRQNILSKLNVANSVEACRLAYSIGLFKET